jgi:hypothetical protein
MRSALDIANFGLYADPRMLAQLAQEAEDSGWDGFFIWDHVQVSWPDPVGDPTIALAAIALATKSIRFARSVIPLSLSLGKSPESIETYLSVICLNPQIVALDSQMYGTAQLAKALAIRRPSESLRLIFVIYGKGLQVDCLIVPTLNEPVNWCKNSDLERVQIDQLRDVDGFHSSIDQFVLLNLAAKVRSGDGNVDCRFVCAGINPHYSFIGPILPVPEVFTRHGNARIPIGRVLE